MDAIYEFDFAALDALQTIHNPALNMVMAFFTTIGEGGILWIALALMFFVIKKTRLMGWSMIQALAFEGIISELIIKNLVQRQRPFLYRPEIDTIVNRPTSFSFPSGHTCTAFACSTVIFCFNKKLGIVSYIVAVLIGFSRNYFFIHFPTDVLCGMLEGIVLGLLAVVVVRKLNEKLFAKKEKEKELTAPREE